MASKQEFFAALSASAVEPTPLPELAMPSSMESSKERFVAVLESVGGVLGEGTHLDDVQRAASDLVSQGRQVLSLVQGITGNRDPSSVKDPHELADVDYTIAPAQLAVAENGAVWISGDALVTRNSVFICEHLIAVVDESAITGTMNEAIRSIGRLGGRWGVFVSGPSKTADIEQALVMGAHGARSMTVYLVRGGERDHAKVSVVSGS